MVEKKRFHCVVMTKRVGSRFFKRGDYGFDNPQIGTVIDTTVVKQTVPDKEGVPHSPNEFYLISQSAMQGTVNPTHFDLVYNYRDQRINPKIIQDVTFMLTHMYYNWTVSYSLLKYYRVSHILRTS